MSSEAVAGADATATPKRKVKLPILIAAGAAIVLLGGGGGFYFMSSQSAPAATGAEAHAGDGHAPAESADPGAHAAAGGEHGGGGHGEGAGGIFDLPPMTVNLASSGDSSEFLKLVVALEFSDPGMVSAVEPRLARVIDAFQVYLRELRRSDLEGSAGIYRLKEELRRRVNLAIYPAEVSNVLFKEIIVQ